MCAITNWARWGIMGSPCGKPGATIVAAITASFQHSYPIRIFDSLAEFHNSMIDSRPRLRLLLSMSLLLLLLLSMPLLLLLLSMPLLLLRGCCCCWDAACFRRAAND